MNIAALVRKARSIRRYDQSRAVPMEILFSLVDSARLSPCGGNQQKLRYRIIREEPECSAVFPHISWAAALKEWPGPARGERPTAYIAIAGPGPATADTGIAAQTIQLAAAEAGLGSCMLGAINRDEIAKVLGLPAEMQVGLLIALGYPAEEVVLEEAGTGESLAYYRTQDGKHHVPKLQLKDVLLNEQPHGST